MDAPVWPLFGLTVSTPRVGLRYIDDDLGHRLAHLAARGIHDPATMPFSEPWTDVDPPELERNTLRYYWRCRAETTAEHWALNFAVQSTGELVGMATVSAENFPATRSAETGSWLGKDYQGSGLGREMRRAALYLIFSGLGGQRATTSAWHDNAPSLGVTRSLGYRATGSRQVARRGQPDTMLDFTMTRAHWLQAGLGDGIECTGIEAAAGMLGIDHSAVARRSR
jgi:RimJ/RimL family protein N-acetyltransferase